MTGEAQAATVQVTCASQRPPKRCPCCNDSGIQTWHCLRGQKNYNMKNRTNSSIFLNNSRALPSKRRVLRQITQGNSPESSAKHLCRIGTSMIYYIYIYVCVCIFLSLNLWRPYYMKMLWWLVFFLTSRWSSFLPTNELASSPPLDLFCLDMPLVLDAATADMPEAHRGPLENFCHAPRILTWLRRPSTLHYLFICGWTYNIGHVWVFSGVRQGGPRWQEVWCRKTFDMATGEVYCSGALQCPCRCCGRPYMPVAWLQGLFSTGTPCPLFWFLI